MLERTADKSLKLCGERGENHQMINDNDAPLKNRSFRFLRESQWRVRESDRWQVVRPHTACTYTDQVLQWVSEGAKGNGLRGYSLIPFVRCKYKSVSCSPSTRYDVSFLRDAPVRYRMHAIDLSKGTSRFYRCITSRRRFSISFICSCDSENYHFTNDEIWCERLAGIPLWNVSQFSFSQPSEIVLR